MERERAIGGGTEGERERNIVKIRENMYIEREKEREKKRKRAR